MGVWTLVSLAALAGLAAAQAIGDLAGGACDAAKDLLNNKPISQDQIDEMKDRADMAIDFMITDAVLGKLKAATCHIPAEGIDEDVFAYVDKVHANIIGRDVAYLEANDLSASVGKKELAGHPEALGIVEEKMTEALKAARGCTCDHDSADASRDCMKEFAAAKMEEINERAEERAANKAVFKAMFRAKRRELINQLGLKPDNYDSLSKKEKKQIRKKIWRALRAERRERRAEMEEKVNLLMEALLDKGQRKMVNKFKKIMRKECKKSKAQKRKMMKEFKEDVDSA